MRIRTGCEKKNSETGDRSFLFQQAGKRKATTYFCECCKGAEQKKKKRFKHQRAPLSSLRMLFILLTGLLTSLSSFSRVSVGAHFGFARGAYIQPLSSQVVALLMSVVAVL